MPTCGGPRPAGPKCAAPCPRPITASPPPRPISTWRSPRSSAWRTWPPRSRSPTRNSTRPPRACKAAQANYDMARAKRAQFDLQTGAGGAGDSAPPPSCATMRGSPRPFAGLVTAKSVEPGTLAAPGAPLLTLEREGGFRLEASVDESRLAAVNTGQAGRSVARSARPQAERHAFRKSFRRWTRRREPIWSRSICPRWRSVRSGNVRPGRVFPLASRKVLTIPAGALIERGQLQSVFVVEDGAARTRLVYGRAALDDAVEVLSGLSDRREDRRHRYQPA